MSDYDDVFKRFLELGDEFARACNRFGDVLRACERAGIPPPRPEDVWLSTIGPAAGWRERATCFYCGADRIECWGDNWPHEKNASVEQAVAWLKGRLA
jgi:hypothetical protein